MPGKPTQACAVAALLALASTACVPTEDRARRRVVAAWLEERAPELAPAERRTVARAAFAAERAHGVDAFLLLAVAERESHFRTDVRSHRGARGMMQVRPPTAEAVARRHGIRWTGPDDLDDPGVAVAIAAAYLAELEAEFSSRRIALAAYHRGPTRVRRLLRRGGTLRSRYADRVLEIVAMLEARAADAQG